MPASQAAAGIAVMYQPVIAAGMTYQDHDVTAAGGRHSGRRRGAGKFPDPVGGEIQLRSRLAEHVTRSLATAKRTRTPLRPPADNGGIVAIGIGNARNLGVRRPLLIGTAAIVTNDRRLMSGRGLGRG